MSAEIPPPLWTESENLLFQRLEKVIGLIPCHLKTVLSLSGYGTESNLRDLTDDVISEIEEFMRDLDETIAPPVKEIFGQFHKCTAKFKFAPGEKKILHAMKRALKSDEKSTPNHQSTCQSSQSTDSGNLSKEDLVENAHELRTLSSSIQSWAQWHLRQNEKEKLQANIEINVIEIGGHCTGQYSYDDYILKVSTYLFCVGGPLIYEILSANMGLPSKSAILMNLHQCSHKIVEGKIYAEELKRYLEERKLPNCVWISEDATKIVAKVQYDHIDDQVVGLVPPLKKGIPQIRSFPCTTPEQVKGYIDTISKSEYVYVVLAQPLVINAPPFLLITFGTDNTFTSDDVLNRWNTLIEQLKSQNIDILGFSSDGDTRLLKAMKIKTGLFRPNPSLQPQLQAIKDFNLHAVPCVQDTLHIVNKLHNRLMKTSHPKKPQPSVMGHYRASRDDLLKMVEEVSKDQHLITKTDLDTSNGMNYTGAKKLGTNRVISTLDSYVPESKSTQKYIWLMKELLDSYSGKDGDHTLTHTQRLRKIWCVLFFLRGWRLWLQKKKLKRTNFISSNAYQCVELNAHSFVAALVQSRDLHGHKYFIPSLHNSQNCENHFRTCAARSMSTTGSTVINFSMLDFTYKSRRINTLEMLSNDINGQFILPRWKTYEHENEEGGPLPSNETLEKIINIAKKDALEQLRDVGIMVPTHSIDKPQIQEFDDEDEDTDAEEEDDEITDSEEEENDRADGEAGDYTPDKEVDVPEISELISSFRGNFNIKDYSAVKDTSKTASICFKVRVNGKETLLKKSSFIWLITEKTEKPTNDLNKRFKNKTARKPRGPGRRKQ
ncbi:hypothetical protein DMENIID0001_009430 [Sergentomyia squamirostris]